MKKRISALWMGFGVAALGGMAAASEPVIHSKASTPRAPVVAAPAGVKGFADLHVHQMAEYAFGGRWLYGKHDGPAAKAVPPCSGTSLDGHGFAAGDEGGPGNLKPHDPSGYPHFKGWPRWDTSSHQQVHADWLKRAYDAGLRLMVMSALAQEDFCSMIPAGLRDPKAPCDDFSVVKRELRAARDFEKRHAWYRIAHTPAEARRIIAEGKLAVVLAVEAGNVFGKAGVRKRLDELHALGVRALQPVHQLNNRFGGAAWDAMPLKILQTVHNLVDLPSKVGGFLDDLWGAITKAKSFGDAFSKIGGAFKKLWNRTIAFELDAKKRNLLGLTHEGKRLLAEMVKRRMLIDVSHLSHRGLRDAYEVVKAHKAYPIFVSHGHVREVIHDDMRGHEWAYPSSLYELVAKTGGVVGLRSRPGKMLRYAHSGVANDCAGSSKSFAQVIGFAGRELGLDVAFASDFNGWASNLSPRFGHGDDVCGGSKKQETAQHHPSKTSLDHKGFAHIGLEGEVLRELERLGADTRKLRGSAEAFLRMWERAYDAHRVPVHRKVDLAAAKKTLHK